jgi:hypothetical protein
MEVSMKSGEGQLTALAERDEEDLRSVSFVFGTGGRIRQRLRKIDFSGS